VTRRFFIISEADVFDESRTSVSHKRVRTSFSCEDEIGKVCAVYPLLVNELQLLYTIFLGAQGSLSLVLDLLSAARIQTLKTKRFTHACH